MGSTVAVLVQRPQLEAAVWRLGCPEAELADGLGVRVGDLHQHEVALVIAGCAGVNLRVVVRLGGARVRTVFCGDGFYGHFL